MAKNDKNKTEAVAKQQVDTAQKGQDETRAAMSDTQNRFNNAYDQAVPMQMESYRDIMDQYKQYGANAPKMRMVGADRVDYNRSDEMNKAMQGFSGFADNGGFSGDELASMRSRALSPVQSVYNNSQNEMARQKNIQGGYSPNFNAASAKMRAGTSQQMSDVLQQVNSHIAELQQSGRLSGLQGLGGLAQSDSGFDQNAQIANQNAQLQADMANQKMMQYDPRLQAIQGQAGLAGGLTSQFGGQILANQGQMLQAGNNQLGIGNLALQGRELANNTKSNMQIAAGRVGKAAKIAGQVGLAVGTGGASLAMPGGGLYGGSSFGDSLSGDPNQPVGSPIANRYSQAQSLWGASGASPIQNAYSSPNIGQYSFPQGSMRF